MNIYPSIPVMALAVGLSLNQSRATDIIFDGHVAGFEGTARLGTFSPNFKPFDYKFVYGIDSAGNMASPNYSRAVADGNFRSIGEGSFMNGDLTGVGSASGIEGQQLWLFLFYGANPDQAVLLALFSGSTDAWRAPGDSDSLHIFADSADTFVFGSGGGGQPVILQGLPIPEPSPLILISTAGLVLTFVAGRGGWLRSRAQLPSGRELLLLFPERDLPGRMERIL